jgi:hypothetical protein
VKALQWLLEKWRWFQPKGAVFFPRFGALFVALAIGFGVHSWLATRSAIRVIGTVTENVATKAPDGETVYVTHFRFRLPSGEIIAAVDPILSSENDEPDFAASADVPVLYPPLPISQRESARTSPRFGWEFSALLYSTSD